MKPCAECRCYVPDGGRCPDSATCSLLNSYNEGIKDAMEYLRKHQYPAYMDGTIKSVVKVSTIDRVFAWTEEK